MNSCKFVFRSWSDNRKYFQISLASLFILILIGIAKSFMERSATLTTGVCFSSRRIFDSFNRLKASFSLRLRCSVNDSSFSSWPFV